ncbi:hypothetical protein [Clostridium senegalense]|uniref:hypothetical protein n=1 Tax=Clostridium senegalense TaxID=1465809 RepID=UPI0002887CBA|nr:hypothetical protein [Clostridium senegalense]MBU5225358.1 hypothetical protein [Clostridium senegalense]
MGFKDKLSQSYTSAYLNRYGDRLTQLQGRILSIKVEQKSFLGIINTITATLVVKAMASSGVNTCYYKKRRWFKKPAFMNISQGHSVIIQGLKPDKKKKRKKKQDEFISIINIVNMTNKSELVPSNGEIPKKVQRVKADRRYK